MQSSKFYYIEMLISADAVICGCGGISIPPHLVKNLYFGLYADVVE